MKGNLADGRRKALLRPPGYFEDLCAAGVVTGEELEIPDAIYAKLMPELRRKYKAFDEPPKLDLDLSNYDQALALWRDASIPLVPKELFLERRHACQSPLCSFFAITKRAPAGRCELLATYMGSCSSLHLALALASCPLSPPQQRWCSRPAAPLQ